VFTTTRLQENPGAPMCHELPGASIYQSDLRESQVRSCNVGRLLKGAHFICSFGARFDSNQRKEMHI
jgi:hypothetical protein